VSAADLEAVVPLLLASGCGPLGWWRLRSSAGAPPPTGSPTGRPSRDVLLQAYRVSSLEAAVRERQAGQAFAVLRGAGVEPILAKGWAAARLYPEPGLRPYGDIDLYVRRAELDAARAALRAARGSPLPVDLHGGFEDMAPAEEDGVFARSRTVGVGETAVRIAAPEDHLRIIVLHALRHGLARAVWLCDVASGLETFPADGDGALVLGRDPRRAAAMRAALALAHRLLGAALPAFAAEEVGRKLPSWVEASVLRQWGRGSGWREPMGSFLRRPRGAFTELVRHWPNPIEATMGVRAPWNAWPRFPFQLTHAALRAARFARGVPAVLAAK
jgi:hypothetical protein